MHIYMTPDQEIQSLLKTLGEAGQINPEVITSQQETHRNRNGAKYRTGGPEEVVNCLG